MYEVLKYIYTGKLEKLESLAVDILSTAEKYSLLKLKTNCQRYLISQLSIDNVLNYSSLANTYNAKTLKDATVKFIISNCNRIIETSEFKAFMHSQPDVAHDIVSALAESNVNMRSEINAIKVPSTSSLKRKR